ncbi:MAG: MBL fold metallo-hydrolase [Coriobacteriales bacterium]|jgi:L-ascorbate metabolism protein UlaG (beta-lactamase superfamily)|nr:MBL fold metallo-hydrolase [Coriobacteriales bacterium]
MLITWYGTASVRVTIQSLTLLIDPFVPLPGADYALSPQDFMPAPHVLITHGHLDHASSLPDLVKYGVGKLYATKTPCATLSRYGVADEILTCISPGDELLFDASTGRSSDKATEIVSVSVKCGQHVRFDTKLVLSTLLCFRLLRYTTNLRYIFKLNKHYVENTETLVYEISFGSRRITILGSPGLAATERYAQGSELLIMPYQGSSHLQRIALEIIGRLEPKAVMLNHFDDSFPPISRNIDTAGLEKVMAEVYPQTELIIPERGKQYAFD